jgi:hypothetical protein
MAAHLTTASGQQRKSQLASLITVSTVAVGAWRRRTKFGIQ